MISLKNKLNILGIAGLSFCGVLLETSMNVTFPTLVKYFSTSLNNVQWLTTGYLLTVSLVILLNSYFLKNFSLRNLLLSSFIIFLLGDLLCYFSGSLPLLLVGRILQGISTGITLPSLFATIMEVVPHKKQGGYIGTFGMIVALAPSLGPTYGGIVTKLTSWKFVFVFILPLLLAAGILSIITASKQEKTNSNEDRFPARQFLAICIGLISLTLFINSLTNLFSLYTTCLLITSVLSFVLIYKLLKHTTHPLINLKIFTNHYFILTLSVYFGVQFIQMALTFIIPTLAQDSLGKSSALAGMLLLPGSLVSAFAQPFTGKLMDTRGIQQPYLIGNVCILLASISLVLLNNSSFLLMLLFVLYMVGFSFTFNNSLTLGLQQLLPAEIPDGNAIFNMSQQYAGSLATNISAALITIMPTFTNKKSSLGYTAALSLLVIIAFLVTICIIRIRKDTVKSSIV